MKECLVSIVVPIYSVEKYLPKCVESIRNQTLKDIEIILVDDESPDNCGKMADEYAAEDDRIRVIHQKNKWLGGARNSGMKVAKGEYIACIDADDYIAPDYCETLYNFAKENDCEIVMFNMNIVDDNGNISRVKYGSIDFKKKIVFRRNDILDTVYKGLARCYSYNFNVVFFNSSIVKKGFLFDEDIRYAEDYEAALRVYKIADSVGYCNKALYYYRQNDDSIMHVVKYERLGQIIHLYNIREKFILENNLVTDENLFNSAHLLVKLLIEKFPMVFGIKGKKYSEKRREIIELFKDRSLNEAVKRIKTKRLKMGLFGKLCFISYKLRFPDVIILASKMYSR